MDHRLSTGALYDRRHASGMHRQDQTARSRRNQENSAHAAQCDLRPSTGILGQASYREILTQTAAVLVSIVSPLHVDAAALFLLFICVPAIQPLTSSHNVLI